METGFDSVKLVIIVLVVAVQGVMAARGWLKKKQAAKRSEEAGLGLPRNQDESASPDEAIPDWDPFGEQDPPNPFPQQPQRTQPQRVHEAVQETQAPPAPVPEPVLAIASAPSATLHRVIQAHSSDPQRTSKSRLPGGGSLRSAMIAKVVLDRPVSALRGNRRPSGA